MNLKKLVVPCSYDPVNSVSLFDVYRRTQSDEIWCVQSGILNSQVDMFWQQYLSQQATNQGQVTSYARKN